MGLQVEIYTINGAQRSDIAAKVNDTDPASAIIVKYIPHVSVGIRIHEDNVRRIRRPAQEAWCRPPPAATA